MPWLEKLDARVACSPRIIRWPYLALRWFLIAMGAYLVIGLAVLELSEKRVGLGLGVAAVLVSMLVSGIAKAIAHRP